ncbi:hypothetical protein [Nitrospirillum iridis]|uniref:Cell division protein FtsW (Lipid II flippase) n=1 Tax=Nitrospirillum iridis TaxID=765888 RepID=A0A7X0AWY7_9PROT|nr:hypothetical protein [Nitrospirillum iridis]MBB6250194.1 cell division protein FtsW (lipid II flippase) [Nitrospirillum iridis]
MPLRHDGTSHPRSIGIVCAVGAALLGLVYLTMAGAPMRYLGVNAGALLIGLAMLAMVGGTPWRDRRWSGVMTLAMAILLLGTALFGDKDQDAARWVRLGPLFIQPSLVLLPVMIVRFAQSPNGRSTLGMVIAAVALALQPDRAMAGMLATGLAVLVMMRPDAPFVTPAFASGVASFAVTLIRTDTLRPTPYVEKVFYSAFDVHIVAGLLVMTGAALLLVPAIVGKLCDADHQETYLVFGAVWFTAILSAALGNYPTPIVGYGGSAVIGYVLSLTMLPKTARPRVGAEAVPHDGTKGGSAVYRCPSAVAYLA